MLVSIKEAIQFFGARGVVLQEDLFDDLHAKFECKSLKSIERVVEIWEPWMYSSNPEEKSKIIVKIIKSLFLIHCSSLNCIKGSKSYIGNVIKIKADTPDITTVINSTMAYEIDEFGRKIIL